MSLYFLKQILHFLLKGACFYEQKLLHCLTFSVADSILVYFTWDIEIRKDATEAQAERALKVKASLQSVVCGLMSVSNKSLGAT